MKQETSFKEFIDHYFDSEIKELEEKRKHANRFNYIYIASCISISIVWLILIYFNLRTNNFFNTRFIFISILLWGVFYLFVYLFMKGGYALANKDFESDFKTEIINPIIQFINPEFIYKVNCSVSKSSFCYNKLIDIDSDFKLYSSDLVKGTYQTVTFQLYDYHMNEEKNNGEIRHITSGQNFRASFNKPIRCELYLLPKGRSKLKEYLSTNLGDSIELEDENFHREFEVYANNQVEARYILSPAFMGKLVAIKKHINAPIYISFYKNDIFILTESNKANFDVLRLSKIRKENFINYYNELALYMELITLLKLNLKIWKN